jgi:hypothetical protein
MYASLTSGSKWLSCGIGNDAPQKRRSPVLRYLTHQDMLPPTSHLYLGEASSRISSSTYCLSFPIDRPALHAFATTTCLFRERNIPQMRIVIHQPGKIATCVAESLRLFQIAGGGIDVLRSVRDDGRLRPCWIIQMPNTWITAARKLISQRYFVTSEEVEKHGISQVRTIGSNFQGSRLLI